MPSLMGRGKSGRGTAGVSAKKKLKASIMRGDEEKG